MKTNSEILARMEEDMVLRGFAEKSKIGYLKDVELFLKFYKGKNLEELSEEDIRKYLIYQLREKKLRAGSVNTKNGALRFVYSVTLNRNLNYKKIPRFKDQRRLRDILTKQYAQWIAEDLSADLQKYDIVIYGGSLYASGIIGVDLVTKNPCKNLIIFTVGLSDPKTTDYSEILNKNIPDKLRTGIKVFHLRGGIDYKKLGFMHRGMMVMMKKMTVGKKSDEELTNVDKHFLDTYGGNVQFVDRNSIIPLIEYVKSHYYS